MRKSRRFASVGQVTGRSVRTLGKWWAQNTLAKASSSPQDAMRSQTRPIGPASMAANARGQERDWELNREFRNSGRELRQNTGELSDQTSRARANCEPFPWQSQGRETTTQRLGLATGCDPRIRCTNAQIEERWLTSSQSLRFSAFSAVSLSGCSLPYVWGIGSGFVTPDNSA